MDYGNPPISPKLVGLFCPLFRHLYYNSFYNLIYFTMNNSNVDQLVFHVLNLTWKLYLNIAGEQTVMYITPIEAESIIKLQRERNTGKNKVVYTGDGNWNVCYTFD